MFLNYVIATLSILLYLHGFFPIPARPLQNGPPNNITSDSPLFQRAVLVIIDALRLDFISDSKTPLLVETFKNSGCFIQLKVETPTVTLPRIKALTTGNVPQFVDIILNLASPTKVEDSFIHRAHAGGKRLVFYGDDIWVKLFPEQFMRSEGTSSFFVNDYTEVDDNVTRNVRVEIEKDDWDIMILHYLGLDHIGHVYGPKSPLIGTKLKEMDSIIREMYEKLTDTLFVITGDHGMRDSGGHGGSTHPETNVPLLILGMPCFNDTFVQIDVPANLAVLLGFDIPATSIGQLQDSLMNPLPRNLYLQALKYNTQLLKNKLNLCDDKSGNFQIYKTCSREISEKIQKTSVKQNLVALIIATISAVIVSMKILIHLVGGPPQSLTEQIIILLVLILQFLDLHPNLGHVLGALILIIAIKNLVCFGTKQLKLRDLSFLTLVTIAHPLIFLSSSFLEEEHQFWYFFTNTFIVLTILLTRQVKQRAVLLVALRFVRTINQVGDKWASAPDLADWLLQSDNYVYLQLLFIGGLLLTFYSMKGGFLDCVILILIYLFRMVVNENVVLGQIIWGLLLVRLVLSCVRKKGVLPVWLLLIALLLKPYNVIVIPVCVFASVLLQRTVKQQNLILAHWWMGNLLFFTQGHDNSLASVDISSGYIGLTRYQPLFVFPQVLCHTYAFPVLSHLLLFTGKVDVRKSLSIFVLFRLYVVITVFLVTFLHRHHLFIWSVFAPKMFVEASHFGFLFIEVCCYYLRDVINKYCF